MSQQSITSSRVCWHPERVRISVAPWPRYTPAHQNTPIFPLLTAQDMRFSCGPVPSARDTANPNAVEAEEAGNLLCPRRTGLGFQCCPWQDSSGALGVIREPQLSCANRAAAPRALIRGVLLFLPWKDTAEGISAVNTGRDWPGLPFEQPFQCPLLLPFFFLWFFSEERNELFYGS